MIVVFVSFCCSSYREPGGGSSSGWTGDVRACRAISAIVDWIRVLKIEREVATLGRRTAVAGVDGNAAAKVAVLRRIELWARTRID